MSQPIQSYDLALGDRSYSSWSMRIGLLVDRFDLPVPCQFARLYTDAFPAMLAQFQPARTVPALRMPEGGVISESLAIAEELASRFPDRGLWPDAPGARATARALASEMHAGFFDLRGECPMNLRVAYAAAPVSDKVGTDLRRLERIWAAARTATASPGPWLCGDYCIADAFFAPVAARIAGYGLSVSPDAARYVQAHLADPAFQRWREQGLTEGPDQPFYRRDYATTDWPG
ncbi:glutathione S-transferase [Pseudoruegeria sp. SK021]|uniref:glutathione S-transferase n=1 Tax=Pseudoruegeria sp. SK021 TaxID=1933035 RepID=UPI000A224B3E|nr:glutathione S-transferase [Pseudoruegeria sp. SK021]OSP56065.1 glutathione S-transferase [Pseudoruegeria sp. SK021]